MGAGATASQRREETARLDHVIAVTDDEVAEFNAQLEAARLADVVPVQERRVGDKVVVWTPQPGSQVSFLTCPVFEALYHGTRGPGKTDALLMSFAQFVGRGYGAGWRGVIFRETYPQLADIVAKSEKWFRRIFPGAKFNRSPSGPYGMQWVFPDGERLLFRHMNRADDYWNYHGHEYPFIGWEELTNWADDGCFRSMFACCRSSRADVPRMIRATTNPYGKGHNWVADRYRLHGQWWQTVYIDDAKTAEGKPEPPRVAIHGHIDENKILLAADPNYKTTIVAAASNQAMASAWSDGSWDLVAGGMFDDVWDRNVNNVGDFEVPSTWRICRAFDWGSSRPFSVGWYAISDGSDLRFVDGKVKATVRGDVFRVREWYGWTGRPNEGQRMLAVDVAAGIIEREVLWGWRTTRGTRVQPGPADSAIYTVENGPSVADSMAKPVRIDGRIYHGVPWVAADKRPGSRKVGWEQVRKMIQRAKAKEGKPREEPGFFVIGARCPQFLRTMIVLPRDQKDLDDVDTDAEDHIGDEVRYLVRSLGTEPRSGRTTGLTY